MRVLCGVANESDYGKDFVDTENQVFKRLIAEAEVEAGQKIISQILLLYFNDFISLTNLIILSESYYFISIILFLSRILLFYLNLIILFLSRIFYSI